MYGQRWALSVIYKCHLLFPYKISVIYRRAHGGFGLVTPTGDIHVYLWILRCWKYVLLITLSRAPQVVTSRDHTIVIGVIMKTVWPLLTRKCCSLPTCALKSASTIFRS